MPLFNRKNQHELVEIEHWIDCYESLTFSSKILKPNHGNLQNSQETCKGSLMVVIF